MRSFTLAATLVASTTLAGPLNPPPGAPSPTNKTLQQVEPRTPVNATNTPGDASSLYIISQPGSYYLTEDLAGVLGLHGVTIAASGVTLDLNGFNLDSRDTTTSAVFIPASPPVTGARVLNGTTTGWGNGLDLLRGLSCSVERVTAADADLNGIRIGAGGLVTHCAVYNAGQSGLVANGATVSHSSFRLNGQAGASCSSSIVTDCHAASNGTSGFASAGRSHFTNCHAAFNTEHGFDITASAVRHCLANDNTLDGVNAAGGDCVIDSNILTSNARYGANPSSATGNIMVRNAAMNNGVNNYLFSIFDTFGNTASGSLNTAGPWDNLEN